MAKEIRFNAFTMNTVGHITPGLWTHPRDQATRYTDLRHWADLARTLERGLFDGLFLADVLGVYDVYQGGTDSALRHAIQLPVNDPLQIIPAMALVTEHLGFGVTSSVTFEHPFPFARRLSTLDHLTGGRIAWNIVTSYLDSGARALGLPALRDHDERYDYAEDYLEVCYKLWQRSWDDDAVVRDRERGVYADPARVRAVRHQGPHFSVDAIHLSEPSPQRTPVLFQAGASGRGRRFAGRHAECVFTAAPTIEVLRGTVDAIRRAAVEQGRPAAELRIFNLHTVVLGRTDAEAEAKFQDYRSHASAEGALTLMSGWTGIDFGRYHPDEVLAHVRTNANQSAVESFSSADPARAWTVGQLAQWNAIGGRGPVSVGSAATVADQLQDWIEQTGIDGFNFGAVVIPETFTDIADLLVPELQRRGVCKRAYTPGTLREKLFGRGPRLEAPHPAALTAAVT